MASADDEITTVLQDFIVDEATSDVPKKKKRRRRRPKGNRNDNDGNQSVFSFDEGNQSTISLYSDDDENAPTTPRMQRRIELSSDEEPPSAPDTEMASSTTAGANEDAVGGRSHEGSPSQRTPQASPSHELAGAGSSSSSSSSSPSPPSPSSSSYSPSIPSSPGTSTSTSRSDSDTSIVASPIAPTTVQPIPRLDGSPCMSLSSLRNEMVSFCYKYRHAGVTLPLVLAYFVNHLNSQNKAALIKLFEELTEKVGDTYVLIAPYQPNYSEEEADSTQVKSKVKKQSKESKKRKKIRARETKKSKRQKVNESDSTIVSDDRAHDNEAQDQENSNAAQENDSQDDQVNDNDGTETDTETQNRRQLRESLMRLLDASNAGISRVAIHRKIRSVHDVSLRLIDKVLEEVGQETNRKWFLKRKKRPAATHDSDESDTNESEASWAPTKRRRLRKKTALELEAEQLPPGTALISRFIDLRYKADGTPEYYVQWEVDASSSRPKSEWIDDSAFTDKNVYKDHIDHLVRWKKSGLAKSTYYRKNPTAKGYLDLQQTAAADGDGLCAFKAVGWALHALTGRELVTKDVIEKFQEVGVKRNPNINEPKCGARWPEVLCFIRRLCSKKVGHNIKLDFELLTKNLSQGGAGLEALKKAKLGPGLYLVAGNNTEQNAGHCVVVEVDRENVLVHEEDISGGVENIDWLHQVSYIRRIKLKDTDEIKLRKLWGQLDV